jgi:hypothetical protein
MTQTGTKSLLSCLCCLIVSSFMAFGVEGYYVGHCTDGRALAFSLYGPSTNPAIHLELEGAGVGFLDFKTNTSQRLEFGSYGGDEEVLRRPVIEIWISTTNPLSGRIFLNSPANGLPFTATKIASTKGFSRARGLHLWGRGGSKEFSVTWPDFQDRVPFHTIISKQLAAEARKEGGEFIKDTSDVIWDGMKSGSLCCDWNGSLETDVVWLGTNIVSLFQLYYEYTGGAHGNSTAIGRNFVWPGGKVRELHLQDLFLLGGDWLRVLSSACVRELRRQKAGWVLNENAGPKVNVFNAKNLSAFNMDRRGLIIHFDPYAVDCYAAGMYHVEIPWSELKDVVDPKGPVSLLY